MAAEPSRTEIQTLFKRLRAIPTNKVRERGGVRGQRRAERVSPGSWRLRGGEGPARASLPGVVSARPRLEAPDRSLISFSAQACFDCGAKNRVGPASRTVFFCALTAPGCIAPWASISASSGGVSSRPSGTECSAGRVGCLDLDRAEFGVR